MPELNPVSDKHLDYAYGIHVLGKKHKIVKQLNKNHEPSVHGIQNWLSSFVLADYLLHKSLLKKSSKVLELGCGWGPASIFCASHAGCQVTGLDIDDNVFPFLEAQAEINQVTISTKKSRFEEISSKSLSKFDVLIGSDICFWDELEDSLFKLIKRALKGGVKHIIIADPGRSPFLNLATRCEMRMDLDYLDWYCTEPEEFGARILHIRNK
tara:strand:+ start:221 stop:853 length:633 start_codon:yes stop_codon:yes gene_type:complete